jgi:integrase
MAKRANGTGSLWSEKRAGYEVWVGQVRVSGGQYQRVLGRRRMHGSSDGDTRAMAEKALRRFRDEVEERTSVSADHPRDRTRLSVVGEEHCVELETMDGRRPWTVADYRQILARHVVPFFGDRPLAEITTQDVEAFIHYQRTKGSLRKEGTGLNPSTVANHIHLLSAIFKTAMRKGIVGTNPVAAARKPRVKKSDQDIRFLSVEELEALLRAVEDNERGMTDAAIFLTAAMTGLRRGELIALRWRDVDWVAGRIRVRRAHRRGHTTDPKSETSKRSVPMPPRVAGELDRHFKRSRFIQDDDPVFCNPYTGRHYDPDTLTERFQKALKRAGVQQVRFHDLRHTFGTRMASMGVPLKTLQAWMGHANSSTTEIYTHYSPDVLNEGDLIERAFGPADLSVGKAQLTAVADG